MWTQEKYQQAIDFAATAHGDQKVPGKNYAYVVHTANVCQEIMAAVAAGESMDGDLAIQCALLHDTLEDTPAGYEELATRFGRAVADGVQALTKDESIAKPLQMADSLARINRQPPEVGMVKMADRITNLQIPPHYWDAQKKRAYREEAREILAALQHCSRYLADRLEAKIAEYAEYFDADD